MSNGSEPILSDTTVPSGKADTGAKTSFFREHLFKIIATVVGTLAVAFIQWEYQQLTAGLVRAQCDFIDFAIESGLDDVQVSLAGMTLADLNEDSTIVRRVNSLVERSRKGPKTCESRIAKVAEATNLALRAYLGRQYQEVVTHLTVLDPPSPTWAGLLYQLRGSALFSLSARATEPEKGKLLEQAKYALEAAERIALSWGGAQGLRISLLAACRPFIGQISKESSIEAIKCLNKLKDHGVADYYTYANLATKHARLGQDELALVNLEECINLGGHRRISRNDLMQGGVFDSLEKGRHKDWFAKLMQQFKP